MQGGRYAEARTCCADRSGVDRRALDSGCNADRAWCDNGSDSFHRDSQAYPHLADVGDGGSGAVIARFGESYANTPDVLETWVTTRPSDF